METMRIPSRRRLALLPLVAALLLFPARPSAETILTVNPGLTVSWVFGRGLTYGLELSFVRFPGTFDEWKEQPFSGGITLDLATNFRGLFKMGVGAEVVGPFVGVEAGPVLVRDRGETHLGFAVSTWAGMFVMPYYGYTFLFGDAPNQHELGTYLKLHLDPNFSGTTHSHSDWDD
jgi:hypothetical protein